MLTEEERRYLDHKYSLQHLNGDNRLLSSVMRHIRKSRPLLAPDNAFSLFETNNLAQIWLQTPACRFSVQGKCTICNYWSGQKIPGLIRRVEQAVYIPPNIDTILINTCGSCLDPEELTAEEQLQLFQWLNRQHTENIIFETHMATLSEDTVRHVHEMFPDKKISFEIGQESTDRDVQFYSLNKPLADKGRAIIFDRVHRYGMEIIVNVILGAPFLSRQEQIEDAVSSITALLREGADYTMLFPVNIKPATLIHFLYETAMYEPVDGDMIIGVLDSLPMQFLPRVNVAWYGEHQEPGVIPPRVPETDRAEFNTLLATYNDCNSMEMRKGHLQTLLHKSEVQKWKPIRETMDKPFMARIDRAYSRLCERVLTKDEEISYER